MSDRLRELVELGRELGLEGEELREFVKEQQALERDERAKQRELEALAKQRELEALTKQRELEALTKQRELEVLAKQQEIESQQHEFEAKQRADEIRLRELEVEKCKIEAGTSSRGENEDVAVTTSFNWSSVVKLVPKFSESDVSKYFLSFEKLMKLLVCPPEYWTLLLQSVLIGKALEVYSCLDSEQSENYEVVKEAILNAYKLVPEAYRIKFRNHRKTSNVTFLEFARTKTQYFDNWCASLEVKSLEALRELILLEDFKNNIPQGIKLHIEESKVDSLLQAAELADKYSLTHHFYFKTGTDSTKPEREKGHKNSETKPTDKVCYACKKPGHLMKHCFKLKAKNNSSNKPVGLLNQLKVPDCPDHKWRETIENFGEHLMSGEVSSIDGEDRKKVVVLRDTGAAISLLLKSSLPENFQASSREYVIVGGFPDSCTSCPIETLFINTDVVQGNCKVAVVDELPVSGVEFLLGNDLVRGKRVCNPIVMSDPLPDMDVGVVTRTGLSTSYEDLSDSNIFEEGEQTVSGVSRDDLSITLEREDLIAAQKEDESLKSLFGKSVTIEEVDDCTKEVYVVKDQLLYRKYRPVLDRGSNVIDQIVVPSKIRNWLMSVAHENLMSGHLGIRKTYEKLHNLFYWPSMRKDVKVFVNSCHPCQLSGKPNKRIPKAPLINIPSVGEPFEEVVIDLVGPLPKSKRGNQYILSIMDRMSRYPEAVPIRNGKAQTVVNHLVQYFTHFGLPKRIQTDNGTNFTSKHFREWVTTFGIEHKTSTPYHPESQGVVERFHQTLKSILRKLCNGNDKVWDDNLPFALFAIRSAPSETLGMSPFELVFGHRVRGPLEVIKDLWEKDEGEVNVIDKLGGLRNNLFKAWELASEMEEKAKAVSKIKFDKKTRGRSFEIGDLVLALLPKEGSSLEYKFSGPFKVIEKRGNVNYLIEMEGRKTRWIHINLLKKYNCRDNNVNVVGLMQLSNSEFSSKVETSPAASETNSQYFSNLEKHLHTLNKEEITMVTKLLERHPNVIKDTPGRTPLIEHDVELTNDTPIKQHPYRLSPAKSETVKGEIQYMLKNGLIVPSNSPWASPILLVKKEDNSDRLCMDYRKVNSVTKSDNFPLPRVIDCLDRVGQAKYISKIDLLKGYWQVPLSKRAQKISAFVTPSGSYECKVMPFGMRNAASTFQRLMSVVLSGIDGCVVYLDDIVVFSDTLEEHLKTLEKVLTAIEEARLVINLKKCEFCQAQITYLGHKVGFGQVIPKESNIKAILDFPPPQNKKEAMRFIGMVGYFRRFVPNFSQLAAPITSLFKKRVSFSFDTNALEAFNRLKAILVNKPVLMAPDFGRPFKLAIDASDIGVGAVLMQEKGEVDHPVSYFSKKLDKSQINYSTIEKELLALVLSLRHFEVYVNNGFNPIRIYTDHNPLVYINKFKNKNKRLTRWSLELQDYDLEIFHIKGADNKVADALSRY